MPTIIVPGKPMGQPRQRHANIGGHLRNYTPATHPIHGFKLAIRAAWMHAPMVGPLMCSIECVFDRPKSKTKKKGPNPPYPHTAKPDCDNIAKAVCDALIGVAYSDDATIAVLHVRKRVGVPGEQSRVIVAIEQIE